MLLRQQKTEILPRHFLMLPRYLLQTLNFYLIFTLHLTIYYARYSVRKHPSKSKSLTVYPLKMILLLSPRLSIPQFSTQLMVRKSYIYFILLQQTWTKKIFLDVCRYQCWKFRADSTRYHWCIISCSFSSTRASSRKGTMFTSPFILLSTDSILLIRFPLLIYRHLILQLWAIPSTLKNT